MGEFAEDVRAPEALLHRPLDLLWRFVHRADDIASLDVELELSVGIEDALVLHRTRQIHRLNGLVRREHVRARAGLVAERPDDDRRMVPKNGNLVRRALDEALAPRRVVRERLLLERMPAAMAFDVRLGDDVDSVLVAQVVPVGVVRVVRSPDGVDVELFD